MKLLTKISHFKAAGTILCFICAGLLIHDESSASPGSDGLPFTCMSFATENEGLICGNKELKDLEVAISKKFYELLEIADSPIANVVKFDQENYILERRECKSDVECTKKRMHERFRQLNTDMKLQLQSH